MPTNTPNLNLIKPLVGENYDVVVANANNDILDTEVANKAPKANPVFTGTQTLPNIVTNGIKFPATQVPSADPNTLDDYEEGSFTPTIIGTATVGTGTYSVQTGIYTKIGRLVHFQILLTWSAHTGTGSVRISGLPFTSVALSMCSIYCNFISLTASNYLVSYTNYSNLMLGQLPVGGGAETAVPMDTSGSIFVSGTYTTS